MEPSYKHLDKETLNALLDIQRQNLGVLEVQAAVPLGSSLPQCSQCVPRFVAFQHLMLRQVIRSLVDSIICL